MNSPVQTGGNQPPVSGVAARCPACGKRVDRDAQARECPRCGVDLALWLRAHAVADELFETGRRCSLRHPEKGEHYLLSAWHVRPSPEVARGLACALWLQRDYQQAMLWRSRALSAAVTGQGLQNA